jgi:glycosyltransferase involved in cell wall biosynthesis
VILELLLGGLAATTLMEKFMLNYVIKENDVIYEPPFTSIVMCSLNEEGFIETALKSLANQNIVRKYPNYFEWILIDSHSTDRTAEIAEKYGWTVYQAPKGKLNARDLGMQKARGSIVVSVDCDTFYPVNWLNLVLKWFRSYNIVAVATPRLVNPEENAFATKLSVWVSLVDVGPLLAGGMRVPGQSMALRRAAYFSTGGFNLNINQQNVHEMVREEEIAFARRLRQLGRVPVEWKAPCFTSLRRVPGLGKGKHYEQWQTARRKGERF